MSLMRREWTAQVMRLLGMEANARLPHDAAIKLESLALQRTTPEAAARSLAPMLKGRRPIPGTGS